MALGRRDGSSSAFIVDGTEPLRLARDHAAKQNRHHHQRHQRDERSLPTPVLLLWWVGGRRTGSELDPPDSKADRPGRSAHRRHETEEVPDDAFETSLGGSVLESERVHGVSDHGRKPRPTGIFNRPAT